MINLWGFITLDNFRANKSRREPGSAAAGPFASVARSAQGSSQPGRTLWVDYAKGWGIFLVVLGHALRGLAGADLLPRNEAFRIADQWIYAFHMPLFFFLSGLFIEQSCGKSSLGHFTIAKLQTIAYPYFVWSILQGSLKAVTDHQFAKIADLWRIIYEPQMQFWFLFVLFVASIAYGVLRSAGASRRGYFAFCLAIYAGHVFSVNFGPWDLLYTIRLNLIYFGLGVIVTRERCEALLSRCTAGGLSAIAALGFAALSVAVLSTNLAEVSPLVTPLLAAMGIASSLALVKRVEVLPGSEFLHQWGIFSLQIYVVHTIASAAVRILLQKGLNVTDPTAHLVLGTTVGIYVPLALALICQKINFPYLFSLRPAKPSQPHPLVAVA